MFILDYIIYRIVAAISEMFWDKIVLGSRLYNTRGYVYEEVIVKDTNFYTQDSSATNNRSSHQPSDYGMN